MSQRRREDEEWVWSIGRLIALLLATALFYPPFRQNVPTAGLVFLGILVTLLLLGAVASLLRTHAFGRRTSPLQSTFWTQPTPTYLPQSTYELLRQLREGDAALASTLLGLVYQKLDYKVAARPGLAAVIERQGARSGLQYCQPAQGKVGVKLVRSFKAALTAAELEKGILIASEGYTHQAAKLAGTLGIELLDETALGSLLDSARAGHDTTILAALPNSRPAPVRPAEISTLTAAESR